MSAKLIFAPLAVLVAAPAEPQPAATPVYSTEEARAQGKALVAACDGQDGWSDPAPPARIYGNTYFVGTCGITAILITSPDGHALIDTGPEEAAPVILNNIRALGFDPGDVKAILFTHEHYDHMGGLAALAEATGAEVWSSAPARPYVEAGTVEPEDPQFGSIDAARPVKISYVFDDYRPITIGDGGLVITPVASPGHTIGATSWNWRSCEGDDCRMLTFASSISAVNRKGYQFTDHLDRLDLFPEGQKAIAAMSCDILITGHPSRSNLHARMAGDAPLVNPNACREYAADAAAALMAKLATAEQ